MVKLEKEDRKKVKVALVDLHSLHDVGLTTEYAGVRPLNNEHLENLEQSEVESWPTLLITKTDQGYVVVDGYHRIEVAKRKKLTELEATSKTFNSENDVVEAAYQANLTHGLKSSAQTRSDYAYWLYKTYPGMEQKEIARRAMITQPAVSVAIARREAWAQKAEAEQGGQGEEPTPISNEQKYASISKTFRSITRTTANLFKSVGNVDDRAAIRAIRETIRSDEERENMARVGRLLIESAKQPRATKKQSSPVAAVGRE
jgi:hypothetical protein